jgi:UDP-glucuronate decarboxylase
MARSVHLPLPQDDPKQRQPNIALAKAQLGWEPKAKLAPMGFSPRLRSFGLKLMPTRR